MIYHAAEWGGSFNSSDALRDLGSHFLRVDDPSSVFVAAESEVSGANAGDDALPGCFLRLASLPRAVSLVSETGGGSGGERYCCGAGI